jgi:hypothetical protein
MQTAQYALTGSVAAKQNTAPTPAPACSSAELGKYRATSKAGLHTEDDVRPAIRQLRVSRRGLATGA